MTIHSTRQYCAWKENDLYAWTFNRGALYCFISADYSNGYPKRVYLKSETITAGNYVYDNNGIQLPQAIYSVVTGMPSFYLQNGSNNYRYDRYTPGDLGAEAIYYTKEENPSVGSFIYDEDKQIVDSVVSAVGTDWIEWDDNPSRPILRYCYNRLSNYIYSPTLITTTGTYTFDIYNFEDMSWRATSMADFNTQRTSQVTSVNATQTQIGVVESSTRYYNRMPDNDLYA